MKVAIRLEKGNDHINLFYTNVTKVYEAECHALIVECAQDYTINNAKALRCYNVSTRPYIHHFYDAVLVSAE